MNDDYLDFPRQRKDDQDSQVDPDDIVSAVAEHYPTQEQS